MHEQQEFDDGARRLLLFLERPEVQQHIGTPEAYARYLGAAAFGDWDRCCAIVNGLYMERATQEAFVAQNLRPIVELDMPEEDWFQFEGATSANVMYLPPRPEVARRQLVSLYDSAGNHEDPQASALLLRLGIYYAHRMFGGNTRGGAIHEALALRGYDGSAEDRRFYATLTKGRSGVREVGMDIDMDVLPKEFATWYQGYVAQEY